MIKKTYQAWWLAWLIMLVRFISSSIPADELPSFGIWDHLVKKSGHVLAYGLLSLACLHGFEGMSGPSNPNQCGMYILVWCLAILFSATDEYHQSFVPGRFASIWDVIVFDNLGALAALVAARHTRNG